MKTVLVTGGTTRLGAAIAARLRAEGWQVLTSSHRPDAGADFVADLSDPSGAVRLYAAVLQRLGRPPDALVNNAALFTGADGALETLDFVAPKKLTMLMASRETGRGAVVNILDTRVLGGAGAMGTIASTGDGGAHGVSALPSLGAYVRAKRRLFDYTLDSAALFAQTLCVNAVAPGPVMAPTDVHEKAGEMLVARPTPDDVAAAVAFLLSTPSVTGVVLPVDGGQYLL